MRFFHRFPTLLQLLCLLAFCALFGCAPGAASKPDRVPRADAGYTHWLEQQALLTQAERALTPLTGWPETPRRVDLGAAGSGLWLLLQPQSLVTTQGNTLFAELAKPETIVLFKQLGLDGIYLDSIRPSGFAWRTSRSVMEADSDATAAGLADGIIPDTMKGEAASAPLRALADLLATHHMALGASLVSPFTGAGPDFLLASQGVRWWPHLFGMTSIPRALWATLPELPAVSGNAPPSVALLPAAAMPSLQSAGLLPTASKEKNLPWAVTGEMTGQDGVTRRWLYRALHTPTRPVLCLTNPSDTARRLLYGAAVETARNANLRLAGVSMEAAPEVELPEALRFLRQTAHTYGAALVQRDRLPVDSLPTQLENADLVFDSLTAPQAEYALLTGNTAPLQQAFDAALKQGLDQRRLLRPLTLTEGMNFAAADLESTALQPYADTWGRVAWLGNGTARLSLPGLAALRAGLVPGPELMAAASESRAKMQPLHELVLLFRGGLPGRLHVTGQDLAGTLYNPLALKDYPELTPDVPQSLPGWGLDSHITPSNTRGVPAGVTVYRSIPDQMGDPSSFVWTVARLSELRRTHGIADAVVESRPVTANPGSIALLLRLPDNTLLLNVANFSDKTVQESFPLLSGRTAQNLWNNGVMSGTTVTLPPFTCKWLRIR